MLSVGVIATALLSVRLVSWLGYLTLSDSLVWMLDLSCAWIQIGIALKALASVGWLTPFAGIHALTIGAIAGMIVSVSSRAALGHTNRTLAAHPLLTSSIVFLNLTAILLVSASIFNLSILINFSALA